jgi:hypothetical protein
MDEADLDLNRVRVDISVQQGRISLQNESLHLADFDFCNMRSFSAWQCTKDGMSRKRISFVAVPSDVSTILRGILRLGGYCFLDCFPGGLLLPVQLHARLLP